MNKVIVKLNNVAALYVESNETGIVNCLMAEGRKTIYFDLLYKNDFKRHTLCDDAAYEQTELLIKEYSCDRVFVFLITADSEESVEITEFRNQIDKFVRETDESLEKTIANRRISYSDKEKASIEKLQQLIPFSFQMTEELNKNLRYIKVCGGSLEQIVEGVLDKYNLFEEGTKANKNLAKQVLTDIKKAAIENNNSTDLEESEPNDGRINAENNRDFLVDDLMHEDFLVKPFTNIYIEESLVKKNNQTRECRATQNINIKETDSNFDIGQYLEKYPEAVIIPHYKDVFNRHNQDFYMQKKAQSLILAENHDALLYAGAPFCQSFGNEHFYYTSNIKNCIYNCEYCYLQGLYPCGHLVAFVNLDDYFREVDKILKDHPVYLCISYDTDLLALEPMFHFVEKWLLFAKDRPKLKIEVRTKCGNAKLFEHFRKVITAQEEHGDIANKGNDILPNVYFAWTLSPESVVSKYERNMPGLSDRLKAVQEAQDNGFKTRLCFDPMIFVPDFESVYAELFKKVFETLDPLKIEDVSVGVFRISSNFLKKMRDSHENSAITSFPYVTENGACHYGEISHNMVKYAKNELVKYIPETKIFSWEGN